MGGISPRSGVIKNKSHNYGILDLGDFSTILQVGYEIEALFPLIKEQLIIEVENYRTLKTCVTQYSNNLDDKYLISANIKDIIPKAVPHFKLEDVARKYSSTTRYEALLESTSGYIFLYCNSSTKNTRKERKDLDELTLVETISNWIRWEKIRYLSKSDTASASRKEIPYGEQDCQKAIILLKDLCNKLLAHNLEVGKLYQEAMAIAEYLESLQERMLTMFEDSEDPIAEDKAYAVGQIASEITNVLGRLDFSFGNICFNYVEQVLRAIEY